MCFPVNFVKFLKALFLQNTSGGCFTQNTGKQLNKVGGIGVKWVDHVHKMFKQEFCGCTKSTCILLKLNKNFVLIFY